MWQFFQILKWVEFSWGLLIWEIPLYCSYCKIYFNIQQILFQVQDLQLTSASVLWFGLVLFTWLTNVSFGLNLFLPGEQVQQGYSVFRKVTLMLILQTNNYKREWHLNLWRPRPISYRNQSINLQSKSMDWFPYDIGLGNERVKPKTLTKSWLRTHCPSHDPMFFWKLRQNCKL